jgi:hypothetical protein
LLLPPALAPHALLLLLRLAALMLLLLLSLRSVLSLPPELMAAGLILPHPRLLHVYNLQQQQQQQHTVMCIMDRGVSGDFDLLLSLQHH